MKDKRNCNNMYPMYPNIQMMGPAPVIPYYSQQSMNTMDINSIERQLNSLENRVSNLERKINSVNNKSNYSESNYYMV